MEKRICQYLNDYIFSLTQIFLSPILYLYMESNTFREKVYEIAKNIPAGKVMTYGQLASLAGSPKAARAVGMSMKCNADPSTIPCHRVVASDGKLVDYAFGGVSAKKDKLVNEGVIFVGENIDLSKSLWKPTV